MSSVLSETADSRQRRPTLHDVGQLVLDPPRQFLLEVSRATCDGDAAARARKQRQAHDLVALSQIAPPGRLDVGWIDLCGDLRALLRMRVPVACRPDASNVPRIAEFAVLGLTYPSVAARQAVPGAAFVQILEPRDVWLPSVRPPAAGRMEQPLCLGVTLPANVRITSIVLMTWGALSMQAVQVNERDAAGVFNEEAARWWQQNMHRIPLTSEAFLGARSAAVKKAK